MYDGSTDTNTRLVFQNQLANKQIDALISMKCLDQGVDVPEATIAIFMASTQNSQQFVQQRKSTS